MASSDLIFDQQHKKRVEAIIARLKKLYAEATARFTALSQTADYDGSKIFSFSDYPDLRKEADKTVRELSFGVQQVVTRGTSSEWEKGNVTADSVIGRLLKTIGLSNDDLSGAAKKIYFDHNQGALKAFQQRKLGSGQTLSQRIWDISKQHKLENELAISVAHGTSADETAKTIQNLLKEPDKLYRRVRDEFGELQLSKHARQYSPGAGVYRSSYKNAMRLARTEINMSYRNAEIESYQDKDYIVGYEVHRSTHDYGCDLCEDLKGKYPKSFKFNGWHPNCRCFITPILISEEEMAARREAILNGDAFDTSKSKNAVTDVPKGFKKWVSDNSDRIDATAEKGTLPYFLRDNASFVSLSLSKANDVDYGRVSGFFTAEEKSKWSTSIDRVFPNKYDEVEDKVSELFKDRFGSSFAPVGKTVDVSVDVLHSTQNGINAKNVISLAESIEKNGLTELPTAIRVGGDVFVKDGHHRVAAEILAGKKTVPMRVIEVSPEEWFSAIAKERGELYMSDVSKLLASCSMKDTEFLFGEGAGVYSEKRKVLHKSIIKKYVEGNKSHSNTVYMLGGAPANGKSTLVDSGLLKHPAGSLVIDADNVKGMIPEYASMVASGDGALVGPAARFVHEESSMLGKAIQKEAFAKDLSVVIDGVNDGSFEKVKGNVAKIKAMTGGKRIRADYVTLDANLSMKLAKARAAKTGRLVPEEVILSGNKGVADIVPKLIEHSTFDELYLWDTNINGTPRLILKQIDGKLEIFEPELYEAFLKKQAIVIQK